MSVEALQARIKEVSTHIERQKEVLKELQNSKSALQRQLNDIRDPMARFPFEISSEIFTLCLPSRPQPGAHHIPMLFLNICNSWAQIAASTPALWKSIHVEFPRPEGFSQVLEAWLERARNKPLSMSLHRSIDDGVTTVIRQHTEQLQSLEIYADVPRQGLGGATRMGPFPSLQTLVIGTLPDVDALGVRFSKHEILELLRCAPSLVECTFANPCILALRNESPPVLVLPSLRHLKLGRVEYEGSNNDATILRYLTLPALETLDLHAYSSFQPMEYFGDFLKRSTSSIKKLALHVRTSLVHNFEEQLVECIRLIPSLTHIELHGSKLDKPIADALFSALCDPSGFLPNLLSIKIGHFHVPLSNNSYDALYRALSLRHPPIICFELIWTSRCNIAENWLDVHLLAAFRQLLAEGMKIHIGSKHRNFITV